MIELLIVNGIGYSLRDNSKVHNLSRQLYLNSQYPYKICKSSIDLYPGNNGTKIAIN